MKLNRNYLYIIISSLALIMVLIIQFNWILQTARIKEEIFNEKANMVLSRTAEALRSDTETCQKIGETAGNKSLSDITANLGSKEVEAIDSLFTYYMKFYNFHIDYSFEVARTGLLTADNKPDFSNYIYNKPVAGSTNRNLFELKLIFPDKKQFILAEMGTMFITSVMLIVVVLVMFWRTMLSLMKEKSIAEHTTDFLNNMTHEFKTPLTNIALAGRLIAKGTSNMQEDKIKYYSGIILDENEKLKLQVEQVLSMTAFERGEIPLLKTELDFHELIRDSVKRINIQIDNKKGNLNLILNADKFIVIGDRTHLTNTICNLIDNALKYCKEIPEISIQTSNTGAYLLFIVSDKGIGIEKPYQKKVFEKFYRVPTGDIHDVKGFGLGLSYIKKIIELHEGTIEVQSVPGIGTTFSITLPYV